MSSSSLLLSEQALSELSQFGWTVVPQFWPEWRAVAQDFWTLRQSSSPPTTLEEAKSLDDHNNHNDDDHPPTSWFGTADIGHDGMSAATTTTTGKSLAFRDIRHSETCSLTHLTTRSTASSPQEEEAKDSGGGPALGGPTPSLPSNSAREALIQGLHELQNQLQTHWSTTTTTTPTTGPAVSSCIQGPLDTSLMELLYAYYPPNGYYKRHVDAQSDDTDVSSWRQYSFVLYLNDSSLSTNTTDHRPVVAGGQLRLYRDGGGDSFVGTDGGDHPWPNFVDVVPNGGTLVLFCSQLIPHEVLWTHSERAAVVGWFGRRQQTQSSSQEAPLPPLGTRTRRIPKPIDLLPPVEADTLTALRTLRRELPGLQDKLEPASLPPTKKNDPSGLLPDADWGITMPGTSTVASTPPLPPPTVAADTTTITDDTMPVYWKSIATFDEQGRIVTLGLAGSRLHKVRTLPSLALALLHPALLQTPSLTTLNLANTNLPLDHLEHVLETVAEARTTFHTWSLPLSSEPDSGMTDPNHGTTFSMTLHLYLGGNALSNGLSRLVPHVQRHPVTVLDLRYTDLTVADARALSRVLQESAWLQKLYLEGNALGDEGIQALLVVSKKDDDHHDTTTGNTIPTNVCHLRELYLGQNDIGPTGALVLARAVSPIQSQQSLSSSSSSFVLHLPVLEKLYLEGNRMGNAGAQVFHKVLVTWPTTTVKCLQKLYVDNNGMDKQQAIALGAALNSATVIGEGGLFQD